MSDDTRISGPAIGQHGPVPSQAVALILARLQNVRPSGRGWMARCPAHEDRENSLSVGEGRGGRVLLTCFAGCKLEAIVEAAGLSMADLFTSPARGTHKRTVVAQYDYRDADGKLLYQVLRYAPKTFRQRRPGPNGRWIWNLDGVERVLYRLPELLAADPEAPVFIVEGEKDVDRLRALGLTATCNPGGAGKWRDEYDKALRGRDAAIVPDNDKPGREHAFQVAMSLHDVATSANIVTLDGLPEKGDVSDYLDAGHACDDLMAALTRSRMERLEKEEEEAADLGPVDGALLANEILTALTRYLVLPTGGAVAMTIWVLHAHALDAFDVSPILCLRSATKRCGKTSALLVLSGLVPQPLVASNITAAATFRAIAAMRPTLLVDEADSFLRDNEELRGVLNSSHLRRAAYVLRCVGEGKNIQVKRFSTWCAKAIALIGTLPETLHDRSLTVTLQRKLPSQKVPRLRADRIDQELSPMADRAAKWAAQNHDALRDTEPDVPGVLNDRQADNWRPLLAIAEALGGCWLDDARLAARVLSGGQDEGETSVSVQVLFDLRDLFAQAGQGALATNVILTGLAAMEERPWAEFRRDRPITAQQLAGLLRPFGIRPHQVWIEGQKTRGYEVDDLKDALDRYTPTLDKVAPVEAVEPALDKGSSHTASHDGRVPATTRQQAVLPVLPALPDPGRGGHA